MKNGNKNNNFNMGKKEQEEEEEQHGIINNNNNSNKFVELCSCSRLYDYRNRMCIMWISMMMMLMTLLMMVPNVDGFQMNHVFSSRMKLVSPSSSSSSLHESNINNNNNNMELDEAGSFDPSEREMTESEIAEAANELAKLSSSNSSIDLSSEVSNSFMQYALSIILGRALPDARDGLKPVHRRILYAMNGLSLWPGSSHRKCARVVGEVLGKYHPHGDMAVYDALVRLAQTFATGTPLIDGHGNFGSIDNDPAAAMRYTECRLTRVSQQCLLEDLNLNTVDFIDNFDGNEMEPTVLPAKLPFLLLNGCAGIAVGMATNVPPHNLNELLTATTLLASARLSSNNNSGEGVSDELLLKTVPGPDFPTAAKIIGTEGAKKLYMTGNGGVTMRAVTHIETPSKSKAVIVVTQLPYQVNKSTLLEKIANLVNDKKLEGIKDLRDESDRDGIRVVIELKRDAVPAVVLNNLYQKTPLQTSFSGNFLALMGSGTIPKRFTLRSALDAFLDFRFQTIRRKSNHQLQKVDHRIHIVDGLLTALTHVDHVIHIIRSAKDTISAKAQLMQTDTAADATAKATTKKGKAAAKATTSSSPTNVILALSSEQADAVLKLQLGQLTRLNKNKLTDEKKDLSKTKKQLKTLIDNDDAVYEYIMDEQKQLMNKFGQPRRTIIEPDQQTLQDTDLISNEQSVIIVTRSGYIKRMPLKTFESQGRGTRGKKGITSSSDNDNTDNQVAHCFTCNDHDTLLMISQKGVAYGLRAFQVPTASRTAKGVPIPSVLPISPDDIITSILPVSTFTTQSQFIILATEHGWIKKTPIHAFQNLTSRGLIIASLADNDRLKWCHLCTDNDDVLIGSKLGKATRFPTNKLRPTSRTSRGVISMKLKQTDTLADMSILKQKSDDATTAATTSTTSSSTSDQFVLALTSHGYGKRVSTDEFRAQTRGGLGVIATKFKKTAVDDYVSCMRIVHQQDEILVNTAKGILVRQKVKDIPTQGRAATGVIIQKVDIEGGDYISSVSLVPANMKDAT